MALVCMPLPHSLCSPLYSLAFSTTVLPVVRTNFKIAGCWFRLKISDLPLLTVHHNVQLSLVSLQSNRVHLVLLYEMFSCLNVLHYIKSTVQNILLYNMFYCLKCSTVQNIYCIKCSAVQNLSFYKSNNCISAGVITMGIKYTAG